MAKNNGPTDDQEKELPQANVEWVPQRDATCCHNGGGCQRDSGKPAQCRSRFLPAAC